MYFVYILKSEKTKRYYIGQTKDLENRLHRHNAGYVSSTQHGVPWRVVHVEQFHSLSEARLRENEIKGYKGGILFKKLLGFFPNQ